LWIRSHDIPLPWSPAPHGTSAVRGRRKAPWGSGPMSDVGLLRAGCRGQWLCNKNKLHGSAQGVCTNRRPSRAGHGGLGRAPVRSVLCCACGSGAGLPQGPLGSPAPHGTSAVRGCRNAPCGSCHTIFLSIGRRHRMAHQRCGVAARPPGIACTAWHVSGAGLPQCPLWILPHDSPLHWSPATCIP
jgi:hypothetical protein